MNIVDDLLLSLALAMDCFSVALTCGIIERRFHAAQALTMALLFGAFQALMPLIGWCVAGAFMGYVETYAPIIACALLLMIGGKMVWESLHHEESRPLNPNSLATLLYLAVATSIDALAVGVTFSCVGLSTAASIARPLVIIGVGSFLLSLLGKLVGATAGRHFKLNAELLGGIILIALGIKTLIA